MARGQALREVARMPLGLPAQAVELEGVVRRRQTEADEEPRRERERAEPQAEALPEAEGVPIQAVVSWAVILLARQGSRRPVSHH
jgi:hypothetical protein